MEQLNAILRAQGMKELSAPERATAVEPVVAKQPLEISPVLPSSSATASEKPIETKAEPVREPVKEQQNINSMLDSLTGILASTTNKTKICKVKVYANWNDNDAEIYKQFSKMMQHHFDADDDGQQQAKRVGGGGTAKTLPRAVWNNRIELTTNENQADYFIVINFLPESIHQRILNQQHRPIPLNRTLYLSMESRENRSWFPARARELLSTDKEPLYLDACQRNNAEWTLPRTYQQLLHAQVPNKDLKNRICALISGESRLSGHRLRLDFLHYLDTDPEFQASGIQLDLYGKGHQSDAFKNIYRGELKGEEGKYEFYSPYPYCFAGENSMLRWNNTEKFFDPQLTSTLPIYMGPPPTDVIDHDSYIQLDPNDFAKSKKIIMDAFANNEFSKRLPAMQRARLQILNSIQMWATVDRMLSTTAWYKANITDIPQFQRRLVYNLDRRPDRYLKFRNDIQKAENDVGLPKDSFVFERVPAVDGTKLVWNNHMEAMFRVPKEFKAIRNFDGMTHGYAPGVLGCALTHILKWSTQAKKFEATGRDPSQNEVWMTCEDDMCPSDFFMAKLIRLWNSVKNDPNWDIIYLSAVDMRDEYYNQGDQSDYMVNDYVMRLKFPKRYYGSGTGSFLIRSSAAVKLVKLIQEQRVMQAIDHFMLDNFDSLVCYMAKPLLFIHSGNDTDIQRSSKTTKDVTKCMRPDDFKPTS